MPGLETVEERNLARDPGTAAPYGAARFELTADRCSQ